MQAPPGTTRENPDPARQDKTAQDISVEVERLVSERTQELQAEVDALRRENARLQHDERVLQENGTNYRQIFESMREGFAIAEMVFDEEGRPVDYVILEIDRTYERQSGLSPEQVVGRRVTELLPAIEQRWFDRFGAVVSTGEPAGFAYYNASLDRWFEVYAFPLHEKNRFAIIFRDITEGKRVQEMLLESEERLRLAMEAADMFGWEVDLTRQTFTWSENAGHVFDLPLPETLDEAFAMVHLEDLENVKGVFEQAIRNPGEFEIEYRFVNRPSNDEFWIHSAGVVIADAGGVPVRIVGVTQNITERKRAEEALREAETNYRELVRYAPAAIYEMDFRKRRFTSVNDAMCQLLGYSREELLAMDPFDITDEEGRARFQTRISGWLEGEEPGKDVEYKIRAKDCRIIDVALDATFTTDANGEPLGATVVGHDITGLKRAEEAALEREEQLRSLIESSADGIVIIDEAGRIATWNRGMEMITGLDAGDVLGVPAWEIQSWIVDKEWAGPDYRTRYRALWDRILQEGTYPHHGRLLDVQTRTPQGDVRYLQQNVFTTSTRLGFRVGCIMRDITERKRTEEALVRRTGDLTRLQGELEVANREANLYLDILTHDIGNTENVANLYAELLIESVEGEAVGYAEKLQRSVKKSIEILGTVSKIRRIHSGTPELRPVDLDAVIREEIGHYPEGIIRYRGSAYPVLADDLLPEVLSNLIGNAMKHGGPAVVVTIRTEEADGFVRVTVADTGPGVPDDEKDAIFHRYEEQKRGVGEGLGLYLVQILIERYGGKVWVEDRVPGAADAGAAFRFTLAIAGRTVEACRQ
jgi:PAS domain S-box-containing protein